MKNSSKVKENSIEDCLKILSYKDISIMDTFTNIINKEFSCNIRSKNRFIFNSIGRKIFILLLLDYNKLQQDNYITYLKISIYLSCHHTTITYHIKSTYDLLKFDKFFKNCYFKIKNIIKNNNTFYITDVNMYIIRQKELLKELEYINKIIKDDEKENFKKQTRQLEFDFQSMYS